MSAIVETRSIDAIVGSAVVIPVLILDTVAAAVPLGRALVAGGLPVIEVTLRTAAGLRAIETMLAEVEGAVVGAGTVTTEREVVAVARIGARFAVSPGMTARLLAAARDAGIAILPGVQTTSELMLGREHGIAHFKFFPAVPAGGTAMLSAWEGPFPEARFCPTGGITPQNAGLFLSLRNVFAVGTTWVAPRDLVNAERWTEVSTRAAAAALWKPSG